jgi:hypothetical protein
MDYLLAIFFPPLYFLLQKKWVPLGISVLLFVIGLTFVWTIFIPLLLYLPCTVVAIYDAQKKIMREHATDIANKMVHELNSSKREE